MKWTDTCKAVLTGLLLLVLAGCAGKEGVRLDVDGRLELADTPFFAQQEYQCGPASLAMLLGSSGIDIEPEALAPRTFLPGRRGSLQLELLAASRTAHRIPYVIPAGSQALIAELQAGRPVLVLQNLGIRLLPVHHYAVVIGVQPDKVVLRSGTTRRLVEDAGDFLATWEQAGSWAMIVLRPGELPANADRRRFVEAVSAFEQAGNRELAAVAYDAALARWPEDENLLFALGNNALQQADYAKAQNAYDRLVRADPGHVAAGNNLAEALARQGCLRQALAVIEETVNRAVASPLLPTILQTRAELRAQAEQTDAQPVVCADILP